MSGGATIEHRPGSLPVRGLFVEVVAGPDKGKSFSAPERLSIGTGETNDLRLADDTVSQFHVEISRVDGQIRVRDLESTNGTRAGGLTLGSGRAEPGTVLTLGKSEVRIADGETVSVDLIEGESLSSVRGKSASMRAVMHKAQRAAASDASILLLGETGTGKEVFARAIHESSPRSEKPFETVDCGSLLPSLVVSELFGHEAGAFTGANQRYVGAFERANGGTIFLDEIGELPAHLQPVLLGALERRAFRRVGGSETIAVDVRVIAATNVDLREAVNKKAFREDLYFRLGVVTVEIPPLRDRTSDIPMLVEDFARQAGHEVGFEELVQAEDIEALMDYRWPGNVRELRNYVEAALAMGEPPPLARIGGEPDGASGYSSLSIESLLEQTYKAARHRVLTEFEERYFEGQLERSGGNVSKAARNAEMNRSYLVNILKRCGLR